MKEIKARYFKSRGAVVVKGHATDDAADVAEALRDVMVQYGFTLHARPGAEVSYVDAVEPQDDGSPLMEQIDLLCKCAPIKMSFSPTKKGDKIHIAASMGPGNLAYAYNPSEALHRAWRNWCKLGRAVNLVPFETALEEAMERVNRGREQ